MSFYGYACTATRSGLCLSHNCRSLGSCSSAGAGGLAVDHSGNLYVADTYNNRVLEFESPFTSTASDARRIWCSARTGNSPRTDARRGAQGLCAPSAVAIDPSGNLYVSDSGNNRVLEFNTPLKKTGPGSGNTVADRVFGQADFNGSQCNSSASASAAVRLLCSPQALAVDSGRESLRRRLQQQSRAEINTPLAGSGDTTADTVFGQGGDFSASACAGLGSNPSPLNADGPLRPVGSRARFGRQPLYLRLAQQPRRSEYNTPLANQSAPDTTASTVFGQGGNFTTGACTGGGILSATAFCSHARRAVFAARYHCRRERKSLGHGQQNNRVLEFDQPLTL